MAKDPAFLFYPNDWIGGTMGMSFEEKGAYMELLMMQFNRGSFSEELAIRLIGINLWNLLKLKFTKDNSGCFYNSRLQEEKEKRKKYSESRRNNRKISKTYVKTYKSDNSNTCLYVIKDLVSGNIKIGASINPKNRLSTLKYRNPKMQLELLHIVENATLGDEKAIQKKFDEFHITGDWFNIDESSVIKHMSHHMENVNENVISNNYKVENFLKDWNEIRKELTNKPSFLNTIGPMEQKEKFTELSQAYSREHFINALKGLFKQERFPKGMSAMNSSPKHFLGHFETYLTAYGDQNKNVWGNED